MARTNEEIKLELSKPVAVHFHGGNPEPHMTPRRYLELDELHAEALAFIQRLQEKNEAMHAEIARLQAERDAAIADIRLAFTSYVGACQTCKHGENQADCIEPLSCRDCENEKCKCQSCDNCDSNWEWRGVQKEE